MASRRTRSGTHPDFSCNQAANLASNLASTPGTLRSSPGRSFQYMLSAFSASSSMSGRSRTPSCPSSRAFFTDLGREGQVRGIRGPGHDQQGFDGANLAVAMGLEVDQSRADLDGPLLDVRQLGRPGGVVLGLLALARRLRGTTSRRGPSGPPPARRLPRARARTSSGGPRSAGRPADRSPSGPRPRASPGGRTSTGRRPRGP